MSDAPPPLDEIDLRSMEPPPSENGGGPRRGDRVPPHSLEAEVSVLGAAMLSRHALSAVVEILRPEDFYRSAHGVVFEAIQGLQQAGAVDTVTVIEWLRSRHRLEEVGGAAAVADLAAAAPTAANAEYYANIVRERALLRRLIEAGTNVVRMGFEDTEDAVETVGRAEAEIFGVAEQGTTSGYSALKDLLPEAFERLETLARDNSEVTGLATGFDDLDRLTAGLQPENLVILAARPAMGKCVTGDTLVQLVDGSSVRIDELVEAGRAGKPATVLSLGPDGTLAPADVSEFHDNGTRVVVRLTTRFGRTLTATGDHPVLTPQGWRALADLQPGDLVASPRRLPVEAGGDRLGVPEAAMLGYLLGDGCLRGSTPTVTTASDAVEDEVRSLAPAFGCRVRGGADDGGVRTLSIVGATERVTVGDVARRVGVSETCAGSVLRGDGRVSTSRETAAAVRAAAARLGYDPDPVRNHLTAWVRELGLDGCGSHDKFVPDVVHRAPDDVIAAFLSRLYACDGSAWVSRHGYVGISYTSVSERLARDVQHLLLRLGVVARLRERSVRYVDTEGSPTRRRAYEVEIRDAHTIRRFVGSIGIVTKEAACRRVLDAVAGRRRHSNVDLLPVEVWDEVLAAKGDRSWADVSAATGRPRNHNWHVGSRRLSRAALAELAAALDDESLRRRASDDVLWDEVSAVEAAGSARVYDLTVPGDHNFVANDLVVHNSSLSLNLAQYVTVSLQEPCVIFSLEMSKIEIVNRMLSAEAGIDSKRIKTGRFDDRDWRRLGDALGRLNDAPLFIDDTPSISMVEIAAKCRRLKDRHGLSLVIIDYLQLMQSHRRVDNRQQEVAEISRGLKMLAKELKVPVIALSQLSRQPESRVDKRPMLADLRESGSIEQDADIVGFIYRDEVYDEQSPDRGIAELIIAKHRNGQVGTIRLAFLNHLTKFGNLAQRTPGAGEGNAPPPPPPPESPL